MKVCAAYGEVPKEPVDADLHEVRLDVFDSVPEWADENTIVTAAGKDHIALPKDFKGIVDVGDRDTCVPCRMIRSVHYYQNTPPAAMLMMSMGMGNQWMSKCACMVNSFADLHTLYRVAKGTERRHLVLGMGPLGEVTRIRQKLLGNEFTFGYVGKPTAPGQFSVQEMQELGDDCKIVGITGHPLGHTKSPKMQNAAMKKAGINGRYLVFDSPDLRNAGDVIREYDITGMNVTIPYKMDIVPQLDCVERVSECTGAVNTIINQNGKLIGTNTDVNGVLFSFEKAGKPLKDHSKVLIHGTGGAARAALYAALSQDCDVYLQGRTPEKVEALAKDAGCEIFTKGSVSGFDAIIQCTPIGMKEDTPYLFDTADIRENQTIMDMVYNRKTGLVRAAEARHSRIADGGDMLVGQGAESFRRWFGVEPDIRTMEDSL